MMRQVIEVEEMWCGEDDRACWSREGCLMSRSSDKLLLGFALVAALPSAPAAQTVERVCARRMSVAESVALVTKKRRKAPMPPADSLGLCNGGVLNHLAVSKPDPVYPARAKAAGVSGTVSLRVCLDEEGKVYALAACNGHPLLLAAAVRAAYRARFKPVLQSGQPTKSNGILTYRFGRERAARKSLDRR